MGAVRSMLALRVRQRQVASIRSGSQMEAILARGLPGILCVRLDFATEFEPVLPAFRRLEGARQLKGIWS